MSSEKSFSEMRYQDLKASLEVPSITFEPSDNGDYFSAFINAKKANVFFHKDMLPKLQDATVFLVRQMEKISKKGKPYTEFCLCEKKIKEGSVTA